MGETDQTVTTEFLANVSRELRTPLALMLGPLEQLLRMGRGEMSARVAEELVLVRRNSVRMLRLVNAMHDFARLRTGRAEAVYEPTDLAELTGHLASNFRALIEGAGLQFVVRCPQLPAPVYVDHTMWEQVVLHLLTNSFEHTFSGEIGIMVRARVDCAELVVRDTGTGIPAEQLPHVFERFHQVPNVKSRTEAGTGNGLALVRELAALHGGTVTIDSAVGQGTLVTVTLPLGTAHLPADQVRTASAGTHPTSMTRETTSFVDEVLRWLPHDVDATTPATTTIHTDVPSESSADATAARRELVLIADDNPDMRHFLTTLLSAQYEVEAVDDGALALKIAQERIPDLVLSDVMMPGLDGFGLLRALRADPRTRTVPVILVSARVGEDSRIEGLDVGADDYLEKPFTARELVARVTANLRLARMRREVTAYEHRAAIAEAANAAKTHFLTTMSHELRTPLNAIGGYVDLLDLGIHGAITDDQRGALGRIRHSGKYLLSLITDILNFTQLEAGHVQYQMRDVSLYELLKSLDTLIEPQALAKQITYAFVSHVPEDFTVHTDPDRLAQIVLNLLTNAVKFTEPNGRVTLECAMEHETDADAEPAVCISVTDTGYGIPVDQCARIFEPFVQLDRHLVRESQQGVGLGLAISRDLIRNLGGELTVESIPGRGSTFRVRLPTPLISGKR